jgi:hypothetical protein
MKSVKSGLALLGLFILCTPTKSRPRSYYVTTETRHYIEPEISPEAWLISLFTVVFAFWLSEKLAPQYVETQDQIEAYSVTVKIKHRFKTVREGTFTAADYDNAIDLAIDFAQREQGENQSLVFKPSITVSGKRHPYSLEIIKKSALPSSPESKDSYWKQIDRDLTRLFLVPPKAAAPQQTHVTHHHVREVEYVRVVPEPRYSAFWIF